MLNLEFFYQFSCFFQKKKTLSLQFSKTGGDFFSQRLLPSVKPQSIPQFITSPFRFIPFIPLAQIIPPHSLKKTPPQCSQKIIPKIFCSSSQIKDKNLCLANHEILILLFCLFFFSPHYFSFKPPPSPTSYRRHNQVN